MPRDACLGRSGYEGAARPTLDRLARLHRRHALTVPSETIDMQLGRRLDPDVARICGKIVGRRRGGWRCETHAPVGWALAGDIDLVGF